MKANYKDRFVAVKIGKGVGTVNITRGSFIFGRLKASEELDINGSMVYRWMRKFEESGMIKIEANSHYSIVTICNYEEYQQEKEEIEQPLNSQRTANEQPMNTTKNIKKDKNNIISTGSKQPVKIHARCKEVFLEKYNELCNENYYWDKKDGANLNPIINKIKFNRNKKTLPVDDDSILEAFRSFLDSITDNWILSNFSIPNINSKFNEIVLQAKIAKNGKKETESNVVDI